MSTFQEFRKQKYAEQQQINNQNLKNYLSAAKLRIDDFTKTECTPQNCKRGAQNEPTCRLVVLAKLEKGWVYSGTWQKPEACLLKLCSTTTQKSARSLSNRLSKHWTKNFKSSIGMPTILIFKSKRGVRTQICHSQKPGVARRRLITTTRCETSCLISQAVLVA